MTSRVTHLTERPYKIPTKESGYNTQSIESISDR